MNENLECNKIRKQLKDYASGNINDELLKKEIEEHLEKCIICKRELLLWQDVLEKQKLLKNIALNKSFKERIEKRIQSLQKAPEVPRLVRQMNAINTFLTGPKGCLLTQIFIITAGFLFVFLFLYKGTNILFVFLVLIAAASMIFLLFKNKNDR